RLPSGLPAGEYRMALAAYGDQNFQFLSGRIELPLHLSVQPIGPASQNSSGRFELNNSDLLWVGAGFEPEMMKWGKPQAVHFMREATQVYVSPPVPVGPYEVALEGEAQPAGPDEPTRWPQIILEQALA